LGGSAAPGDNVTVDTLKRGFSVNEQIFDFDFEGSLLTLRKFVRLMILAADRYLSVQCSDTVGWATGRASSL